MTAKLAARLAEYGTIRAEALKSMEHRNQIAAFGIGGVALVAGGAFVGSVTPVATTLIFCLAIPLISVFTYYLWFAEFERMVRAGRHLQRLELAINVDEFAGEAILSWETRLSAKRLKYPYVTGACLFLGIGIFSPFVAISLQAQEVELIALLPRLLSREYLAAGSIAILATVVAILHSGIRLAFPQVGDLPPVPASPQHLTASSVPPERII